MLLIALLITFTQLFVVYFLLFREARGRLQQEQINNLLRLRLEALERETTIVQQSIENTRILRHDLRHHYRMLYALLEEGDIKAAVEHIESQRAEIGKLRDSGPCILLSNDRK
ncbi:hypothetical protein SAMN05216582_11719 [Selenomonas ruminantium]|uniref:Uncharacterized protein n=1 Tax=Selenomonas ruminantium TaxID=971 RepID=A0A1M6V8C7_SELRU|nr:hypothetical protein [Selenomonas ruminantium]SHK77625.1 hypothetical protein SAMN05216582_11719 [Selenomonas ruminantium]